MVIQAACIRKQPVRCQRPMDSHILTNYRVKLEILRLFRNSVGKKDKKLNRSERERRQEIAETTPIRMR